MKKKKKGDAKDDFSAQAAKKIVIMREHVERK